MGSFGAQRGVLYVNVGVKGNSPVVSKTVGIKGTTDAEQRKRLQRNTVGTTDLPFHVEGKGDAMIHPRWFMFAVNEQGEVFPGSTKLDLFTYWISGKGGHGAQLGMLWLAWYGGASIDPRAWTEFDARSMRITKTDPDGVRTAAIAGAEKLATQVRFTNIDKAVPKS